MVVQFLEGAVLFDSGDVAFDEDCCCGVDCVGCAADTPIAWIVDLVAGNLSPATCTDHGHAADCENLTGSYYVPFLETNETGDCIWYAEFDEVSDCMGDFSVTVTVYTDGRIHVLFTGRNEEGHVELFSFVARFGGTGGSSCDLTDDGYNATGSIGNCGVASFSNPPDGKVTAVF